MRSNAIEMTAGTAYTIKIRPIQHEASPRIREFAIEKRECRFKDEKEILTKCFKIGINHDL